MHLKTNKIDSLRFVIFIHFIFGEVIIMEDAEYFVPFFKCFWFFSLNSSVSNRARSFSFIEANNSLFEDFRNASFSKATAENMIAYASISVIVHLRNLRNLTKVNKEIYLCGDFSIDLLKVGEKTDYQKFYELMSSYGLLPQILYPTREIGASSAIIDNIFTNNISTSIQSGNACMHALTSLIITLNLSWSIGINWMSQLDWCTVVTTLNFQLTASEMMFQFKTSMLNLTMLMIN